LFVIFCLIISISGKYYLIYGASHYRRAALLASEVENGLVPGTSAPAVKKPIVVAKRGLLEGVIAVRSRMIAHLPNE